VFCAAAANASTARSTPLSLGQVTTKEGKAYDMYFARGILPKLIDGGAGSPPPAFVRRYKAYFQKGPPAFSAFLPEA
jgi:hypothetical protein